MNARISRRQFCIWSVVIVSGVAFSGMLFAGPKIKGIAIDKAKVEFFESQSTIMQVHPKDNYLIAGEKTIKLVDFQQGGKRYRTILKNAGGEAIRFNSFKKGQWVFVRGFKLTDGTIAAREIYQLPGRAPRTDSYPFFLTAPEWGEPANEAKR